VKILAARRRGATCSRKTAARRSTQRSAQEDGYILLTLILVIALMAVVATTVIVPLKFEMQRDQEEEMIHRGVQYSRAIRGYYKKFGRYPVKLEDLDNTNNLKYLRKHYKDPMNKNQEFKLLHFGDPGLSLTGSIAGGMIAGATPAGSLNGPGNANGSAFGGSGSTFGGGSSAFGGSSSSAFGGSGFSGTGSSFGGSSLGGASPGGASPGGSGVNSNGVFAQSSGNTGNGSGANSQTATGEPGTASGSDSSQGTGQGGSGSGNPLGASGPIVGVASLSKKSTIREFNHKNKYNDWQFIYDPAADRGGLITTPNQPSLQALGFGTPAGQAGNSTSSPFGQSSSGQSSFGQSSFGQSSGQSSFGQSSFGNNSGGFGTQPPPPQSQPNPQPPQ
jgi:type II secretory pathway pseudopilin PulG